MRNRSVMAGVGTVLLTWLVVADTWIRLSVDAEPTSLTIVAIAVTIGMLAAVAGFAVRDALIAAHRAARAPSVAGEHQAGSSHLDVPSGRPHRVGGRGPRAPGSGLVLTRDSTR
ncbi:hypothetical protein ACX9R5_15175 [Rathayibacter sp. CAU 1779]